jgi:hypothetical protein
VTPSTSKVTAGLAAVLLPPPHDTAWMPGVLKVALWSFTLPVFVICQLKVTLAPAITEGVAWAAALDNACMDLIVNS